MAEKEPLISSGRLPSNYDANEYNDDNIISGSRPGSAVDGNINANYHDSSSDYHDYSAHINTVQDDKIDDGDSIVLYKRRWYILFVLSMCAMLQNSVWGTWGPIAESAKFVYGWDTTMIFILTNLGNIGILLPALFTGHMISSRGLRVSMIVCSFLLAVGSGLRTISRQKTIGTILIGAGQFFNGLAGSITQVIPAALSEAWFPVHERATATAIGVISNSVGGLVAFVLGPNIVREPKTGTSSILTNTSTINYDSPWQNSTDAKDKETISHQIWILLMIQFGVGVFLFLLTLLYFPSKPPKPPSKSAVEDRVDFTGGIFKVFRQPMILLTALSCAAPCAVYGNWIGLLDVNFHDIGISQRQAGFFGAYASVAGIVGGIAIGRIADKFQRRLKLIVTVIIVFAWLIMIWITCMRNEYIPRSTVLLAVAICAIGVMMNAAFPLCYEMTCECGYPIHEGIIGTFISLEVNTVAVIFLLVKFIPNIGVKWMNWAYVGILTASIVCLSRLKDTYHRTNVDISVKAESDKSK